MNALVAVRFPTRLPSIGLALPATLEPLHVAEGPPAWAWSNGSPRLPIDTFDDPGGLERHPAWGVDHVVVTAPDLAEAVAALVAAGAELRRTGATARGDRAAFLLAGPLIEVIEVPGRPAALSGIALETTRPLEEVTRELEAAGLRPGLPHDAVQEGRRIVSYGRVAVMTRRTDEHHR